MVLNEYLSDKSQTEFAKRLGVSQGLVWQWMNGRTRVTPEKAAEIERQTKGEVTRRELRPDDWWLVWPELVTERHPGPPSAVRQPHEVING